MFTIPILVKTVLTIIQEQKIIINPMATEVIIDFAFVNAEGLVPAKKYIIPPTTSIRTATGGTKSTITNLITLLNNINKSQNVHAGCSTPPQSGTNPAACIKTGNIIRDNIKMIFFIFLLYIFFI